jgi:DNA-binding XRE family transcriptional regulator
MSQTVLVVTDRQLFAESCGLLFRSVGLDIRVVDADAMSGFVSDGSLVLIDAGSQRFDEDEVLVSVALARALNAFVAVALPDDDAMNSIEDILDELCPGLVTRGQDQLARIANKFARYRDDDKWKRFEYLSVSLRANELVAILGDGTPILIPRPAGETDDGSKVLSISLSEEATTATLALSSGKEITLIAASLAIPQCRKVDGVIIESYEPRQALGRTTLGARLKLLRQAAGLTQAELSRRTGIHRPNIARVEAGRHTPSLETLTRLAAAIGVTTTSVFTEE